MKKENRVFRQLPVMLSVLFCAVLVFAAGEKERIAQRLSKIDALKQSGIVGERANGLLGFVKASPGDKALVDAENRDRQVVYGVISRKQGTSAVNVAKSRAETLAGKAVSGMWFQNASGKWSQKK